VEFGFPKSLPNHNVEQAFYFDGDFLLRRLDYQPDVTGTPIAHYVSGYKEFDGFMFATSRQVHPRGEDGVANKSLAPITLDVESVTINRR
jgi:hypothetical protein